MVFYIKYFCVDTCVSIYVSRLFLRGGRGGGNNYHAGKFVRLLSYPLFYFLPFFIFELPKTKSSSAKKLSCQQHDSSFSILWLIESAGFDPQVMSEEKNL